jgi:hypothetical protein
MRDGYPHDGRRIDRRVALRGLLIVGLPLLGVCVAASGCTLLFGPSSRTMSTAYGSVLLEDRPTCRRLSVLEQTVSRNREGHLLVKVRWLNFSTEAYETQVRVSFYDAKWMPERNSYGWDIEVFRPGEQTIEWTSHTPDAAHYSIIVRERD